MDLDKISELKGKDTVLEWKGTPKIYINTWQAYQTLLKMANNIKKRNVTEIEKSLDNLIDVILWYKACLDERLIYNGYAKVKEVKK